MNFNIYVNDTIAKKLKQLAESEGKSKNSLIRKAIENFIKEKSTETWPAEILNFSGDDDMDIEPFESHRKELDLEEKDLF